MFVKKNARKLLFHTTGRIHTRTPVGAAGSSGFGSCVVATSIAVIFAVTAAAATAAAVGMLLGHVGKILASGGVTHYKKENVKKIILEAQVTPYTIDKLNYVIPIHLLE